MKHLAHNSVVKSCSSRYSSNCAISNMGTPWIEVCVFPKWRLLGNWSIVVKHCLFYVILFTWSHCISILNPSCFASTIARSFDTSGLKIGFALTASSYATMSLNDDTLKGIFLLLAKTNPSYLLFRGQSSAEHFMRTCTSIKLFCCFVIYIREFLA